MVPYRSNFRGAGRSQSNEDTVEASLTAQDTNAVAYVTGLSSHSGPDSNPGWYCAPDLYTVSQ